MSNGRRTETNDRRHWPIPEAVVRKRFHRGEAIETAYSTLVDLAGRRVPPEEALQLVGRWMVEFGEAPPLGALHRAIGLSAHMGDFVRAYLVVCATGAWFRGVRHAPLRADVLQLVCHVLDRTPELPAATRLVILPAAVELVRGDTLSREGEYSLMLARMKWGIDLAASGFTERRDAGFRLLEEQRERAAVLAQGGGREERTFYAQTLHNAGESWRERTDGDRGQNLRRALAHFEACLAIPERREEPLQYLLSLRGIGSTRRYLATVIEDVVEKRALLEQAVADGRAALALHCAHPEMPSWVFAEGTRINLANAELDLLELRVSLGEVSPDTLREAARRMEQRVLPLFDRPEARDQPQVLAARERILRLARGSATLTAHELEERLWAIAAPFERQREELLNHGQAAALHAALEGWGGQRPLPSSLWHVLGALLSRVDIASVGPELAWTLCLWERLLLAHLGERPDLRIATGRAVDEVVDVAEWVGSVRVEHCHRMLANPSLPGPFKDLWSAWIRALAWERLAWHDSGAFPLGPLELARLVDLLGSAAFRSESVYFGQGEAWEPRTRLDEPAEPVWRCDVYRTRFELDVHALAVSVEMLGEPDRTRLRAQLGSTTLISLDGSARLADPVDPREALAKERQELDDALRFGADQGWYPARAPDVPVPCESDIAAYLGLHPDRGVALLGPARSSWSLLGVRDTEVERTPLWCTPPLEGGPDPFPALLVALVEAQEVLRVGHLLTPDGHEIAHAAALALPPEEQARVSVSPPTVDDCERLDRALDALGAELAPVVGKLARVCAHAGRGQILVLSRLGPVQIPWAALAVPGDQEGRRLGDVLALTEVPSLAPAGARLAALRDGPFGYVGSPTGRGALEPGRVALQAVGLDVAGPPLSREALEAAMSRSRTVTMLSHGVQDPLWHGRSWLCLDDTLHVDDIRSHWTAAEIRAIDLTGCARVELWACESGQSLAFLGLELEFEEPAALDAAFLLAGARCVISSLWKQPLLSASLIAAAFRTQVGADTSGAGAARALARATASYREAMKDEGAFVQGAVDALQREGRNARSVEDLRRIAARGGWAHALESLSGRRMDSRVLAGVSWDAFLGPMPSRERQRTDEVRRDPLVLATELARQLRGPWAWAGWRVILRDKECM